MYGLRLKVPGFRSRPLESRAPKRDGHVVLRTSDLNMTIHDHTISVTSSCGLLVLALSGSGLRYRGLHKFEDEDVYP